MAITAALVYRSPTRLRYLITATAGGGEAVSIESDGGVSPDLVTDSVAGPLKNIVTVKTNGYGKIAVGGITTQAQARALLNSDDAVSLLGAGIPSAILRLTERTTTTGNFAVDCVRGPSDQATPGITVTANGIGICYLDVEVPGAIGCGTLAPP